MITAPEIIEVSAAGSGFDERLAALPNTPAVFLLHAREGAPHLARTALLRRRLLRLLRERDRPSRLLNLRGVAERIEYWPVASRLESNLVFYELARRHHPETYLQLIKLRMPAYVKVLLSNPFPRTQVTTRLTSTRAFHYGPFRTRGDAEQFEEQTLDLFQVRRCQEHLAPSPEHPGCIYGEMNMCLRPCQDVVGTAEYASEVERLTEFLATGGKSLLETVAAARDRLSEEMQFEEAARQHARYERIQQVTKLRDDLVAEIDRLYGVAVAPSTDPEAVELFFVDRGLWHSPVRFVVAPQGSAMAPLDQRLKETAAALPPLRATLQERQEHLALLARWFYSSWRDGEWLQYESPEAIPYRRLVRAVSRVASRAKT
ncbi:MAG: hypothetical protein ACK5AZ_17040 [Bryobacteraceae bacterium]